MTKMASFLDLDPFHFWYVPEERLHSEVSSLVLRTMVYEYWHVDLVEVFNNAPGP